MKAAWEQVEDMASVDDGAGDDVPAVASVHARRRMSIIMHHAPSRELIDERMSAGSKDIARDYHDGAHHDDVADSVHRALKAADDELAGAPPDFGSGSSALQLLCPAAPPPSPGGPGDRALPLQPAPPPRLRDERW